MKKRKIYVVLHDVRSVHNVGAIFRTADGAGACELLLVGYTPTPVDRFGRPRADMHKTALGAELVVPWQHIETLDGCLDGLKKHGIDIVFVEQMEGATPYREYVLAHDTAFVFGNEREGVPTTARAFARAVLEIPMHGQKESLNVATAAGVILFHFAR